VSVFAASLSGACASLLVTETDGSENSEAVESDFLLQQQSDCSAVDGSSVLGLTGLYNSGRTCYVNATIQALSNWLALVLIYSCMCVFSYYFYSNCLT